MAIFYLGMKTFGRSRGRNGSRATSAAAYRAGERVRDERTGRTYDHRHRSDVLHKQIVLPAQLAQHRAGLEWARDRSRLWNAAEHAESRRNARVAREFIVALPHEITPAARTRLARQFAQEIADRYRSAVDVAIHGPRGDARNFHAHLLSTTREVTPDGLGRKTTLELSGSERHRQGLPRWREEIASLREHWADLTNRALEAEHVATRVSPLTRAERGLMPAGPPRLPLAAYHMERRGGRSYLAERIRARYQARLEGVRIERAEPGRQRAVSDTARTRLGRLRAGVKTAWQRLQATLGVRWGPGREALARGGERSSAMIRKTQTAAQSQRSEQPRRAGAAHPEPRRAASHRAVRDEGLRSALRWKAYVEKQRAKGLLRSPEEMARESALNWRRKYLEPRLARGAGAELEPSRRSGASQTPRHERGNAHPDHAQEPHRERDRSIDNGFSL